jgi:hypothetical protein
MRHLFWMILLILSTGTICLAQQPTTAPTPLPNSTVLVASGGKTEEPPVKLSRPLIKIQNDHAYLIAYLVSVKSSDNPEKTNFQLKIYYREKLITVQPEDESPAAMLLVDGRTFELSAKNSDFSVSENRFTPELVTSTQIFTFNFLPEDISFLAQAKSLSIIWNKINAEIKPEGLDTLHKFVLSETSR